MSVAMPDPPVSNNSHDASYDTDQDRAAHMVDINFGPKTLLEEKVADERTPGTAEDETGIAAEIIARNLRRGHQPY